MVYGFMSVYVVLTTKWSNTTGAGLGSSCTSSTSSRYLGGCTASSRSGPSSGLGRLPHPIPLKHEWLAALVPMNCSVRFPTEEKHNDRCDGRSGCFSTDLSYLSVLIRHYIHDLLEKTTRGNFRSWREAVRRYSDSRKCFEEVDCIADEDVFSMFTCIHM